MDKVISNLVSQSWPCRAQGHCCSLCSLQALSPCLNLWGLESPCPFCYHPVHPNQRSRDVCGGEEEGGLAQKPHGSPVLWSCGSAWPWCLWVNLSSSPPLTPHLLCPNSPIPPSQCCSWAPTGPQLHHLSPVPHGTIGCRQANVTKRSSIPGEHCPFIPWEISYCLIIRMMLWSTWDAAGVSMETCA